MQKWLQRWPKLSRWQTLSLIGFGAVFLWEVATVLSGYYPPHECGGQGQSYQDACDHLILATRPFRPLARLVVHYRDFLIAVGTIGLTGFTATLWAATRGLVKGAERTGNRQLRAYVFPDSAALFDRGRPRKTRRTTAEKAEEGKIGGSVVIKNSGQTPAYKVAHWAAIVICRPDEADQLLRIAPFPDGIGAGTLAPGGAMSKTMTRPELITAEEIAAVKAVTKLIYLYGRVEYVDILGRLRFTNYRLSFGGNYPPYADILLLFSERGNESDQNQDED